MAIPHQVICESSNLGDLEKFLPTSCNDTGKSYSFSTESKCNCDVKGKVSYSPKHFLLTINGIVLYVTFIMSLCAVVGVFCLYRQVHDLKEDNAFLLQKIKDCSRLKLLNVDFTSKSRIGDHVNDYEQNTDKSSESLSQKTEELDNQYLSQDQFLMNIQNTVEKHNDENYYKLNRVKRSKSESKNGGRKSKKKKRKGKRTKKTSVIHLESKDTTNFDGTKFTEWQPIEKTSKDSAYYYEKGDVAIQKDGVYFIYSQVTYYTVHPTVSFGVYVKESNSDQAATCIMKCINAVDVNGTEGKRHQHCYSAKAVYLKKGQQVYISDVHGHTGFYKDVNDVMVDFSPELTFWGIIKMS